jgi:mannosyl-oligosaccharide alpha-1,2-mannosidase
MYGWSGGCSVLAEFGSIELEFDYLSRITGHATYAQRARKIRDVVTGLDRSDGLFPVWPIKYTFAIKGYFSFRIT